MVLRLLHLLYQFLLLLSLIPSSGLFLDLGLLEDYHNHPEDLTIHEIWPNILTLGPMHPCYPMSPEEEIIEFRWNTPPLILQEPTLPSEICQLIAPCPTYPIKPSRLLQDYLEWDQDEDEDNLNLYKRLDLIRESWHANSLVGINLDEWSHRVHLHTSEWVVISPNSEVFNASQAHSTPPPQYSHG